MKVNKINNKLMLLTIINNKIQIYKILIIISYIINTYYNYNLSIFTSTWVLL